MSLTKNDHGRGFRRSRKQWEASFADHIGEFIDKIQLSDIQRTMAIAAGTYSIHRLMSWTPVWVLLPLPYELKGPGDGKEPENEQQRYGPIMFSLFASYMAVEHGIDLIKSFPKI